MTLPIQNIPFTNHLGHVIQPGDTVIAIASGYAHSVHVQLGRYIGLRMSTYQKDQIGHVVVSVPSKSRFAYNEVTKKYENTPPANPERNTCLPDKRIYPSSIPLSEFAGKRL